MSRSDLQPIPLSQAVPQIVEGLRQRTCVEVNVARTDVGNLVTSDALERILKEAIAKMGAMQNEEWPRHLHELRVELKGIFTDGVVFCVYR